MLKWIVVVIIILGTLSGCFNQQEKPKESTSTEEAANSNKPQQKVTEATSQNHGQKSQVQASASNDNVAKKQDQEGFMEFRPKVGSKKVYVDQENVESLAEEVAYENDRYIQTIVRIGQSTSVVIYKWTSDEISIVSEVESPADPYKNYLTGIKEKSDREILLSSNASAKVSWKVIGKNETVQTPFKSFNHVIAIEKTSNEVEGADTIYTYYLAPGAGIIKQLYQVTGDQGYTGVSLLQKLE
ncbi:hypothetical protein V7152_19835 [Neobacillus drentensis]|uniref:hypothetical protein n=1 Tax=Neobacillus drentensis TaxID=220684 RepID=UPI002FFE0D2F